MPQRQRRQQPVAGQITRHIGPRHTTCRPTAGEQAVEHRTICPLYGSAEIAFGEILKTDFAPYRDELIISSKAGYDMWPGPYGEWGSRKYLIASCDQSLKRMGLDLSLIHI